MKKPNIILNLFLVAAACSLSAPALAQSTAFTYQGRLDSGGVPTSGSYDLRFAIFSAASGGVQQGTTLTNAAIAVSNGLFTVTLDFGNQFTGSDRWLEIGVRTNGGGAFNTLAPRQQLTSTPYAVRAANYSGVILAGQIFGTIPLTQLPTTLVTNGASGVNFSGTYSGNGAGVTNVDLMSANDRGVLDWTTNYGNFVFSSSPSVGFGPSGIVSPDVNGDGKVDLVFVTGSFIFTFTNNGSGGFTLRSSAGVGGGALSLAAADVNGDGKMDIITANFSASTLSVMTNDGSGGFALSTTVASGSGTRAVTAADVNGDGKPDLIHVSNSANTMTVVTNNGAGGFVLSSSHSVGNFPMSVTSADVNGDGKPDLISANGSGNNLTVLTNNGSGGFALSSSPSVGASAGPVFVIAADVNGDGKPDFITANNNISSTLAVLTNNGLGGLTLATTLAVGNEPTGVAAADVNLDGKVDLISANSLDNTLTVLTNSGGSSFALAFSLNVGAGPFVVIAPDVNGDGKPDLVSGNQTDNNLTVLLNTATFNGTVSESALSPNVALLNKNQTFTGTNIFSGNLIVTGNFLGSPPYLKFVETKPVGTDGGANNAGTNNFRKFTKSIDTHGLGSTNSNGDIILPSGTYQCRISAPGYRVNSHQTRLRTSTGAVLLYGTTEYSDNVLSPSVQSRSVIEGQFTLSATTTNQVQHYMAVVRTPNGLGVSGGAAWTDGSPVEVYSVAEFWKIK